MNENALKQKQVVEKQHYIPQFYLKRFENSNHLVERLDVINNRIMRPSSKKSLCFDSFFYAVDTGVEDEVSQVVEEWLGHLESHLSQRLPEIDATLMSDNQVSDNDKYDIAVLMAMLYLRGPVFRDSLNKMNISVIKQLMPLISKFSKNKVEDYFRKRYSLSMTKEELDKLLEGEINTLKFNNVIHLEMMNELRGFSNMLFGQEWLVYRNKFDYPFITSDNPLSPERLERTNFYSGAFMDYTYHFALSPQIHIVSRAPKYFDGKKLHRKTLTDSDESLILKLNVFITDACTNYVYSSKEKTLKDMSVIISRYHEMVKAKS